MSDVLLGSLDLGFDFGADIANAVISGLNYKQQKDLNEWNKDFSQKQFEESKFITRENWRREDNAVQRRVEDLKAAGINPVLAAGSAASSSGGSVAGSQVSGAPQMSKFEKTANLLSMRSAVESIKQQIADQELKKQEEKLKAAQTAGQEKDNELKPIIAAKAAIEAENATKQGKNLEVDNQIKELERLQKEFDYTDSQVSGIGSNPSPVGKIWKDVNSAAYHVVENAKNNIVARHEYNSARRAEKKAARAAKKAAKKK